MNNFCQDRDLLAIEPALFLSDGLPRQQLAAGQGTLAGTQYTANGDFIAAGVQAGMVICLHEGIAEQAAPCEIVSVKNTTTLVVSVLRTATDSPAAAPVQGFGSQYFVRTFAPQVRIVSETLAQKLRTLPEAQSIDAADFVPSPQLRRLTAIGALAAIFTARAENGLAGDANWIKAEHYRREFERALPSLRLAADADGDGIAESTRALGNVTLRRA